MELDRWGGEEAMGERPWSEYYFKEKKYFK